MEKSKTDLQVNTGTEVEQLRDRRIAPGATCLNCRHAYPYKVDLMNAVLECRQGPAQYPIAIGMDSVGNIVQSKVGAHVPRIVEKTYFCGCWQDDSPLV